MLNQSRHIQPYAIPARNTSKPSCVAGGRHTPYAERAGFTLFEMVLALAIFSLLIAGAAGAIVGFTTRNDLDLAVLSEVEALRRAERLARSGNSEARWGVKLATGTITVFKGASFAARDAGYDEITEISNDISALGADEFVFRELLATTTTVGTTTLYHVVLGESRNVGVNAKGTISY